MKIAKRIGLFLAVNLVIIVTISIVTSLLGIQPYLGAKGLNMGSLIAFCLLWGFGGAFISLALSRVMAKWMMGVKLVDPETREPKEAWLLSKVYELASRAGLSKMPQVGIYESVEVNAFATGPTKNRSLVAVSSGLFEQMNRPQIEGVLAHEVAHIINGDMVTMTLLQGIVNAFVMFLARIISYFAAQFVSEERRGMLQFAVTIGAEILLGFVGMMIVSAFSRAREFRADQGGATLAGRAQMISALEALKVYSLRPRSEFEEEEPDAERAPSLAAFKISGKPSRFSQLFATHPDLDVRIARLRNFELFSGR